MSDTKTIKGQAWISGDSLVQDIITMTANGLSVTSTESTETLISNIWDDLTDQNPSDQYHYKTNGKGYFYWETMMTSMEDDDIEVKVNIECPKPKPTLFPEPYNPEDYTDEKKYSKYWVTKLKTAQENYENEYAIQRKEVIFNGCSYLKTDQLPEGASADNYPEGWEIKLPDYTFNNSDLGDITNLLSMF